MPVRRYTSLVLVPLHSGAMMASGGRSDMRISQPGLVLTLLLLGASTAAAAPCPQKDRGTLEAWKCFGEVEYRSRSAGEADFGARGYALYRGLDRVFASESAPSALPLGTTQIMYGGEGNAASFMSGVLVEPYPDSISLSGWQYECPPTGGA